LTKWAPRTDFRRKITRIYKSVVIFHSIIMFKSVLSFAFQAEKDYVYKEGQFIFFLPNSLLPSFALRLWYIYNVLSWITTGAYVSYTKSLYNLTKPEAHMIYVTVPFFTNWRFTKIRKSVWTTTLRTKQIIIYIPIYLIKE
jgi:hypothetical protein